MIAVQWGIAYSNDNLCLVFTICLQCKGKSLLHFKFHKTSQVVNSDLYGREMAASKACLHAGMQA